MAKHRSSPKEQRRAGQIQVSDPIEAQLQNLLKQQKYRQALDEIKRIRRSNPDFVPAPPEPEIWLRRGVQEYHKNDFKQAENSFRRALELGFNGEPHYWLARCLLALNRLDNALSLIQSAFENGSLPKEYAICYLKLLLLKGDAATVEQLITQKSKQFTAAQLHWVRGVLALKNQEFEPALTSFQKIKRPLTPEDSPDAWIVYTQQKLSNWEAAAAKLGLWAYTMWKPVLNHPALERLATFQRVVTGKPPLLPSDINQGDQTTQEAIKVLALLQLIEQNNAHDAAHVLLKLGQRSPRFPELNTLRSSLLLLAGQQALSQGQPECSEAFWLSFMTEHPFNPQLAVNLLQVLDMNESHQERQRLLTRLLKWVEGDAKQNPQAWSEVRLKAALTQLHCWLADTWMALDRQRAALGALQQAERIFPESPELIGRRGLIAMSEGRYQEATTLLNQALESGCQYPEVYANLLDAWEELGDKQARTEARRRFGRLFGDFNVDAEVEIPHWISALSTQSYSLFSRLVRDDKDNEPAIRACQIFVNAVQSPPNSGGRVSLNQVAAGQQWDELLKSVSGKELIPVLQAIALSISLFAKREKGIAGLSQQYAAKLLELSDEYPEAREAYLVVLAIKESNAQKVHTAVGLYLERTPQPGNALAYLQLQVRYFKQTPMLRPLIDEILQREPQNPLLLLAKATTYAPESQPYEELREQGFELARRLQDAKALQAFRQEQAFVTTQDMAEFLPDPDKLEDFDEGDMEDFVENMIRKVFGKQIPPSELERMLPQLRDMMLNSMPDFEEEEEDDGSDFDFIFGPKRPRKRRKNFRNL